MGKEINYILALMIVFLSLTSNGLSEAVDIAYIFSIYYWVFKSIIRNLFFKKEK